MSKILFSAVHFFMKNLCSKVITGHVRLKGGTVSLPIVESSPTY